MKESLNKKENSKYIIDILTLTQKAIVIYLLLMMGIYIFYWMNMYTPLLNIAAASLFAFLLYEESKETSREKGSIYDTLKLFLPTLILSLMLIFTCNKLVGIKAPTEQISAHSFKNKQ